MRFFYTILIATTALAQPTANTLDALFSQYTPTTPGVSVGVVHNGKIALLKTYGSASLEHNIPITPSTVFQAASVSKQFTAFAIYLLENQQKLSLEDDIRKYLPELPDYGKPIRIKHLLAHTSGLRDQAALISLAGWRMDDVLTKSQVLRLISRQRELNFEPGSAYLYCNTGYTLLAEIVSRVSGQSFADFTRQQIFEPLQMTSTQFYDDHEKILKNRADSYWKDNGTYKRVNLNDAVAGPSNLYTTAEDMAKWALNFENPKVGDRNLIARFNEPSLLNNGERTVYYSLPGDIGYHAKGQIQRIHRGLNVLSHGGHSGGFRSTFWRFPNQRFAVILLSNDEHFAQIAKAEAIIELYLKDQLQPEPAPSATTPAKHRPTPIPTTNLSALEGRFYNEEIDTAYTAKLLNGKLQLTHVRHGDIPLIDTGSSTFTGRIEFPAQFEFLRDTSGKAIELKISNFGVKNIKFKKTPDSN